MDQNQTTPQSESLFQLNLDVQNSYNLRSAASWAKVLGVVGIIAGAMLIILMGTVLSRTGGGRYGYRNGMDTLFAAKSGLWIVIIAGIIFIVGGIFSYNFGNKMNVALKTTDQNGLNDAFAALRNYFALRSITIIIVALLLFISLVEIM